MRLAIVGASGQTGTRIIDAALERGHAVIGVARTPEKIRRRHERLAVRRADVFDTAALIDALAGADAVLTSIGKTNLREKTPPFNTVSHRNVLDAMKANGIERLVAISSFGAAPAERKGLRRRLYLFLRRKYYGDMRAMERLVLDAPETTTVVRAPMLHNRPPRHDWILTTDGSLPAGLAISRDDLADYLLDELEQAAHRGCIVALADEGDEAPSFSELRPRPAERE